MHIKKFETRDLKDALEKIRRELGPDAVILETGRSESLEGGVTVLAALPRELPASPAGERPEAEPAARAADPAWPMNAPALPEGRGVWAGLDAEVKDLKEKITHLSKMVRSDHFSAIPLPLRQLYFDLTNAEVDADLVFQILQRMGEQPLPGQFTPAPPEELLRFLRSLVKVGGTLAPGQTRRVLALVGPTGVGKTTTVAKIAGHASFRLGLNVALLSTDAYRVFGAQHLASYAALMGLPFETAGSAAELRWFLQGRLAQADVVLIDTSGRSPRDPRGIEEVHSILAACPEAEVHLALAANARARDLVLALDAFSVLPVRHLIFTKLDEATSNGGIYSTALKARRPVSYLGTGQEVPDDLAPATAEGLTEGLLGESENGGSSR
jgi:flagellar biosynthesis protein FlhF